MADKLTGAKPLYQHSIVLRVPVWLLKGTMEWQLLNDRDQHPVRLEQPAAGFPYRYRMRLKTPAWAGPMCRRVSENSDVPPDQRKGLMIQHQSTSVIEDQVWVAGETRVDGVPLVRSNLEFVPTESGQTRCDMHGVALEPRYSGLLANVTKQMRDTVVAEQRRLENRARVMAIGILLALRLAETGLRDLVGPSQ